MKAVKITLLVALFLSLSSQTSNQPNQDSVNSYETTKNHYDLIVHSKDKVLIPGQG